MANVKKEATYTINNLTPDEMGVILKLIGSSGGRGNYDTYELYNSLHSDLMVDGRGLPKFELSGTVNNIVIDKL